MSGIKTVSFRCMDNTISASSTEVNRTVTVLASPFETITANQTKVKAAHITAMRTAVNVARAYYGMAAVSWKEDVAAGKTGVKNLPL